MEPIRSPETSALTTATHSNIPDDGILQNTTTFAWRLNDVTTWWLCTPKNEEQRSEGIILAIVCRVMKAT
jgi:hypothetical protein